MKKTLLIVVGIILVVLGFSIYRNIGKEIQISKNPSNGYQSGLIKKPEEVREIMATVAPGSKPDFIKDGNLRLQGEGTETETWTFLYEGPGAPVLVLNLNFNFRSKCDFGKGEGICNLKKFENGLRVNVEGVKKEEELTVLQLKVLE